MHVVRVRTRRAGGVLIGTVIVKRRSGSEEGVRGDSEEHEDEHDSSNGKGDRPEISRQGSSEASGSITARVSMT